MVIGRDHLDSGSVASPNRETEAMRDGSDAVSDWPLLNALLNCAERRHLGVAAPRRRRRHGLQPARRHGDLLRRHAESRRQNASSGSCGTTRRPASCATPTPAIQRDFVEPEGGCATDPEGTKRLASVVPAAKAAVGAARAAGIEIVHTRESYSGDLSDVSPLKKAMDYVGVEGPLGRCLIRGEPGCDFTADMRPEAGERVVDKAGFSAFYGTDLHAYLSDRGVTHLIVTGVTYQCCVHSTLRDAVERGYFCLTLDDCCAALDAELEGGGPADHA